MIELYEGRHPAGLDDRPFLSDAQYCLFDSDTIQWDRFKSWWYAY